MSDKPANLSLDEVFTDDEINVDEIIKVLKEDEFNEK